MTNAPDLYFRIREPGALVFRVDTDGPRVAMEPLAVVNLRTGETRAQGERTVTPEEQGQIASWMADRLATLAAREAAQPAELVEALNRTAHWAQTRASDADLAAATDDLLLAMHDLRRVLIRRKADREG
jgi:hypothetical protein